MLTHKTGFISALSTPAEAILEAHTPYALQPDLTSPHLTPTLKENHASATNPRGGITQGSQLVRDSQPVKGLMPA